MCSMEIKPYFSPDAKLVIMLRFVAFMAFMNFAVCLLRAFTVGLGFFGFDLFTTLVLFLAYRTLLYLFMVLFVIGSLFNAFFLCAYIGIAVQQAILGQDLPFSSSKDYLAFGVSIFCFAFYLFGIATMYPVLVEMKAQFLGETASINPSGDVIGISSNGLDNDKDKDIRPVSTQFKPFSGKGNPVGGN